MSDPRREEPLLECVEVESPPSGLDAGPVHGSVLWLHGLGADGHDFEPIVPELGLPPGLGVRFVFPHAPVIPVALNLGMRMRAWYDLVGADLHQLRHDEPGLRRSMAHVERLLDRERERGVPPRRVVLAGFSQGGAVALHVGLRSSERLAGVVALSSFLPLPETLERERTKANQDVPILMCHGTADPMVPEEKGRLAADQLLRMGYGVEYATWPMEHQVCLEEIRLVGRWIADRLRPGEEAGG